MGDCTVDRSKRSGVMYNLNYANSENELQNKQGGFEVFIVSSNGEIQRLTYFSNQDSYFQRSWSLSPDETKLAFWIADDFVEFQTEWQLVVLDIPSGEVFSYCVSGGNYRFPETPIWSPSGDKLLITSYFVTWTTGMSEVFFIDLERNQIAGFAEEAHGVVWLSSGE
jgi:Tol biopolymer transport system component